MAMGFARGLERAREGRIEEKGGREGGQCAASCKRSAPEPDQTEAVRGRSAGSGEGMP